MTALMASAPHTTATDPHDGACSSMDGAFSDAALDQWFGGDDRPHLYLVEDGTMGVERPVVRPQPASGPSLAGLDPRVEIYRRRRFAVALALTAVILLACQLAGISLTSFGPASSTVDESAPVVHVVRPGDTYAGIAADLGLGASGSVGEQLRRANGGAELVVGERLVLDLDGLVADPVG